LKGARNNLNPPSSPTPKPGLVWGLGVRVGARELLLRQSPSPTLSRSLFLFFSLSLSLSPPPPLSLSLCRDSRGWREGTEHLDLENQPVQRHAQHLGNLRIIEGSGFRVQVIHKIQWFQGPTVTERSRSAVHSVQWIQESKGRVQWHVLYKNWRVRNFVVGTSCIEMNSRISGAVKSEVLSVQR
jgi:hypothetical protein